MTARIAQRKATEADALSLAARLRQADIDECLAGDPSRTPTEILLDGVRHSEPSMTIYRVSDNLPIAIYGVVCSEPLTRVGTVWMLAAREITQSPLSGEFLRKCREVVALLNETYPILTNVIDARNIVHIRWIEWCGFEVVRGGIYPDGLHEFYLFKRTPKKESLACVSP